jgi:hypothetical protein
LLHVTCSPGLRLQNDCTVRVEKLTHCSKQGCIHIGCHDEQIANHPLISRLHQAGSEQDLPKHPLPPELRLCSKMEVLDSMLLKLHASGHKVILNVAVHCLPSLHHWDCVVLFDNGPTEIGQRLTSVRGLHGCAIAKIHLQASPVCVKNCIQAFTLRQYLHWLCFCQLMMNLIM